MSEDSYTFNAIRQLNLNFINFKNSVQDTINILSSQIQSGSSSINFTPENISNKSIDFTLDLNSDIRYPSVKSVYNWATNNFITLDQSTFFAPYSFYNQIKTLNGLIKSDGLGGFSQAVLGTDYINITSINTAITALNLGTASKNNTNDFDLAGTAAAAQSNANTFTTNSIANLNLGTASQNNTGDFDAAGAATAALTTANSYTNTTITALNLGTASRNNSGDFDEAGLASDALNSSKSYTDITISDRLTALNLGTASTHSYTDFDLVGAAATALIDSKSYTDNSIVSLNLGTASTYAFTAFDTVGSAGSALTSANSFTTDSISALGLGSASKNNTSDFDLAGTAASLTTAVLSTAKTYSDSLINGLGSASKNNTSDFDLAGTAAAAALQAQNNAETYAASLVTGNLSDRGSWDASGAVNPTNYYPNTGGSGVSGSILKGNMFYISVAGVLGTTSVSVGASVRALVNNPGQISSNWDILPGTLNYVPENVSNKALSSTYLLDYNTNSSDIKYPSVKSVYNWVTNYVNSIITNLNLGSASVHPYTDFDVAGAAASALSSANTFTTSSITNLNLGNIITYNASSFDSSGAAAAALTTAKSYTNTTITALNLGTASTHSYTDFDLAGTAASALSSANTFTTSSITNLNLGTASHNNTGDFDAAGAATAALTTANSYASNASNLSSGTVSVNLLPSIPTTKITGLAASATTDTTSASNISSGTLNVSRLPTIPVSGISGVLPANQGGAGSINGLLKANGSGTVSLAVANTDYVTPSGVAVSYTWSSKPSPSTITGQFIFISDIGINGTLFYSNGTTLLPATSSPIIMHQSAIPIGHPPSGTFGSNGAYILGATVGGTLSFSATSGNGVTITGTGVTFVATDVGMTIVISPSKYALITAYTSSTLTVNITGTLTTTTYTFGQWQKGYALPTTLTSSYCYFPANAVYAGSSAGLYYTVWNSVVSATVYNNIYTTGQLSIPASPTPIVASAPGAFTQTINTSNLSLISTVIKGGLLGNNGSCGSPFIEIIASNNTNNKTFVWTYGGVSISIIGFSGNAGVRYDWSDLIRNSGSQSTQVAINGGGAAYAITATGALPTYTSVNTAIDQTLSLTLSLANSNDFAFIIAGKILASPAV